MRYDLALSLGSSCNCTALLRQADLQYESFPLDWLGRTVEDQPIGEVFRLHVDMAVDDFRGMLRPENLLCVSREGDHIHSRVEDRGTGVTYYHDFPCGQTVSEAYPAVLEKYRRRLVRMRDRLNSSRSALLVWLGDARDNGCIAEDDIAYCLKRFSDKYSHVRFHLLVIDCPKGFPKGEHRIEHGDGYDRHILDFRYEGETEIVWRVSEDKILLILGDYVVRDYRSRQERRAHRRVCLEKKLAAFHARNRWELFWNKFQLRLYRRLCGILERKGVGTEMT